jgi:hypothetical protein
MKTIFNIICSIIPVFSFNEITPNLCIHCKFFMNSFMNDNKFGKCSLFQKTEETVTDFDYFVTGNIKKSTFQYCSIARKYDDMCGKEGKKYIKNKREKFYRKSL